MAVVERAVADKTDIVIADSVDARDEILAVAKAHPGIAFLIAGAGEPQKPNVSTFDSGLVEPAYLCGLLAGRLSASNIVGVVAGRHEPERLELLGRRACRLGGREHGCDGQHSSRQERNRAAHR